jgi:hypothetical protein
MTGWCLCRTRPSSTRSRAVDVTDVSAQARTRIEGIRARLLTWDPLGIDDVIDAEDEYDCMIGPLARLLVEGASTRAIRVARGRGPGSLRAAVGRKT